MMSAAKKSDMSPISWTVAVGDDFAEVKIFAHFQGKFHKFFTISMLKPRQERCMKFGKQLPFCGENFKSSHFDCWNWEKRGVRDLASSIQLKRSNSPCDTRHHALNINHHQLFQTLNTFEVVYLNRYINILWFINILIQKGFFSDDSPIYKRRLLNSSE